MKALALFVAFLIGMVSGFSLAAWALQEPISVKPAKYTFQRSEGAVPAYALDGTQKLFQIECISESEKDCVRSSVVAIPVPGTFALVGIGWMVLLLRTRQETL